MTRQTILLTGASGVLGTALLPKLAGHDIISLTHRAAPAHAGRAVPGDLTAPRLGVDARVYRQLTEQVDTVVHCAAVTDFSAGREATDALNVAGTKSMLEFAAEAGAHLYYVSTAFVARTQLARAAAGEAAADPADYLASKRAAELLVRASGLPATIVRPAIVIGDSATGRIAKLQGLHNLALAVLKNSLPLLPLAADSLIDALPQDLVAHAIACLVEARLGGGEYWLTAGRNALTAHQMINTAIGIGQGLGIEVVPPRLVSPDMVDRLIRPVFIDPLPSAVRRRFDDMIMMTALFGGAEPFPSSLARIPGCHEPTTWELTEAFAASVSHLIKVKGLARAAAGAAA
jgi:nucleoside-diphosphate-sugar epimerase